MPLHSTIILIANVEKQEQKRKMKCVRHHLSLYPLIVMLIHAYEMILDDLSRTVFNV